MEKGHTVQVLDRGYVKYIDSMGDDRDIVEAARMSTDKGFLGWEPHERCKDCGIRRDSLDLHQHHLCNGKLYEEWVKNSGDLSFLEFLYMNRHMTPFEMGELCIEIKAPIVVFREWHRHRTQSYNEMSGRYIQMPDEHYLPTLERIQKQSKKNKQGSGDVFSEEQAGMVVGRLQTGQEEIYQDYQEFLNMGAAKEIARLNTPVSRYSRMRAKANVRNWLGFLMLRCDNAAQWEIRQYANEVARIINEIWPRTFANFLEHDFFAVRFSRSEMRVLRRLLHASVTMESVSDTAQKTGLTSKKANDLLDRLYTDREIEYPHLASIKPIGK